MLSQQTMHGALRLRSLPLADISYIRAEMIVEIPKSFTEITLNSVYCVRYCLDIILSIISSFVNSGEISVKSLKSCTKLGPVAYPSHMTTQGICLLIVRVQWSQSGLPIFYSITIFPHYSSPFIF